MALRILSIGIAMCNCPQVASAAGLLLLDQSAMYEGASFAGATARADDPSTLFFNPAGMARLPDIQVSISASIIDGQAHLISASGSHAADLGGSPILGSVGAFGGTSVLPDVYVTGQIAPDWHLGLSVTSPFGILTQYDTASVVRYYAQTTQLRTIDIAPSIAWQAIPSLSLGASLIVETADGHLSQAIDFGGIGAAAGLAPLGFLPGRADGSVTLRGNDVTLGFQIGALFTPDPATNIGVSYRSAMFHTLSGTEKFGGVPAPFAQAFPNQNATLSETMPDILSVGIAREIGRFTLLADLAWTNWGRDHELTTVGSSGASSVTPQNWHGAWRVSLGADYKATDTLTLRAGTAWDQSPVPDATRNPATPDADRVWLSVGASWSPVRRVALSVAYAHLFVSDGTIALTSGGPSSGNFLKGNLTAQTAVAIDIVALQTTLSF
jgi:long-chain fatty acid transport protein